MTLGLILAAVLIVLVFWLIWRAIDKHFDELAKREKQGFDDPLKDASKAEYHEQEKL